jgi:hypothetical protein
LDERSDRGAPFNITVNRDGSIGYVVTTPAETASVNEFLALADQIEPLLIESGAPIGKTTSLLEWANQTVINRLPHFPIHLCSGEVVEGATLRDHPYRMAALAIDLFLGDENQDGDHSNNHPWGNDDPQTPLSPAKLADRLGIPPSDAKAREALRGRLRGWRDATPDGGWIEVRDRKPKQAGYLYPVGKVWPVIEDMKPSG